MPYASNSVGDSADVITATHYHHLSLSVTFKTTLTSSNTDPVRHITQYRGCNIAGNFLALSF
jgi:hypothetical protein